MIHPVHVLMQHHQTQACAVPAVISLALQITMLMAPIVISAWPFPMAMRHWGKHAECHHIKGPSCRIGCRYCRTGWRHRMETFSALLVISTQRPVTRSFDAFFDLLLNKRMNKQWWGWWFDRPSRLLWRHCNDMVWVRTRYTGNI